MHYFNVASCSVQIQVYLSYPFGRNIVFSQQKKLNLEITTKYFGMGSNRRVHTFRILIQSWTVNSGEFVHCQESLPRGDSLEFISYETFL